MSYRICARVNSDIEQGLLSNKQTMCQLVSAAWFGQSLPVTDYGECSGLSAFTVTSLVGLFGLAFSWVQTCPHSSQR